LKVIRQNPGIRYRELPRQTGFANGVLTYHLNILEQIGSINKFRHGEHNSILSYQYSKPGSKSHIAPSCSFGKRHNPVYIRS
jgi:predicted transcriptional regulator